MTFGCGCRHAPSLYCLDHSPRPSCSPGPSEAGDLRLAPRVREVAQLRPVPGAAGRLRPTFLHLPAPPPAPASVSPVTSPPALKAAPASVWLPVRAQGLAFNTANDGGGRRFLKGSRIGLPPRIVDEAGAVPHSAGWTVQPRSAVRTEQGRGVSAGGELCTLPGLSGNLP